jgi:hypothetical protein
MQQSVYYCSECPPQYFASTKSYRGGGLKAGEQGLGLLRTCQGTEEVRCSAYKLTIGPWRYRFLLPGANGRNVQQMPGLEFSSQAAEHGLLHQLRGHRGPTATRKHAQIFSEQGCHEHMLVTRSAPLQSICMGCGLHRRRAESALIVLALITSRDGISIPTRMAGTLRRDFVTLTLLHPTLLMPLTSWQAPLRGGEQIFFNRVLRGAIQRHNSIHLRL